MRATDGSSAAPKPVSETRASTEWETRWVTLTAAALLGSWIYALAAGGGAVDRQLLLTFYAGNNVVLGRVGEVLTTFGSAAVLLPISALATILLWLKRDRRVALLYMSGTLIGRAVLELLKLIAGRPRPDIVLHLQALQSAGLPSGHSGNSMLVFLAFAVLIGGAAWRSWRIACGVAISVCVGLSRLMLGVHWPTDVLAGWASGAFFAVLLMIAAERGNDLAHERKLFSA